MTEKVTEKFDEFWSKNSKISKICSLMGCLWPQYIMFELKKYREIMFDDTEDWCKIWRKAYLSFQKWHQHFGKFLPEHLKASKSRLWWDSFIQSQKIYVFRIYRGVILNDNEKRCKTGSGIVLSFQKWREEFDEFWHKQAKISKICSLMDCLWPKYVMFELKKYRGIMFDSTEYWGKIWRKTEFCFQKWRKEFGKFSPQHPKVSKLGFWWDSFM